MMITEYQNIKWTLHMAGQTVRLYLVTNTPTADQLVLPPPPPRPQMLLQNSHLHTSSTAVPTKIAHGSLSYGARGSGTMIQAGRSRVREPMS
jgi:hypothetical protein